jgi:hypothetical protein
MVEGHFHPFVKGFVILRGCGEYFLHLNKPIPVIVPRNRLLIFPILTGLLLIGCRRSAELPELVDSHYIKYDIEYLEERAGDIPTRILPGTMDAYYTRNHVLTRIEGFFNQFILVQVADLRQRKVTTLLNFFGNKVYYTGRGGEPPASIVIPEQVKCRFTGEMAVIGGLQSERVTVDTGTEQFNIYCTREFSVRRPNISTPYRSVDYPLTDFRIQLSLLKMHLTCMGLEQKTIESEVFSIPEDYRQVNRETMEEIINSLFTKE